MITTGWVASALMALSSVVLSSQAAPASSQHAKRALDTNALADRYFGNDAAWFRDRIPYFEISDQNLQDVYYYRWQLFRSHQRDLGERGYISTEFAEDVGWQLQPWASLNDATGFHLGEGRWSRDRRFAQNYLTFMYNGGNDRHFSDYMARSAWDVYAVDGDQGAVTAHLDSMINIYNQWNDHFNATTGLYWIEPLSDATEYTISSIDASGGRDGFGGGEAYRPSINSYMWANAKAIADIANLANRGDVAGDFNNRANALKEKLQGELWNADFQHFADRHQTQNEFVKYYDFIRGRELVGFVPWQFSLPDNTDQFNAAWTHLMDTAKFAGSNGLRTNEPSYEYYMRQYRYEGDRRECQWNGPSWPYQTTQVLHGIANLLDSYKQNTITPANYMSILKQYAQQHRYHGGNTLDLQEDYEPDKPGEIVGLDRSHHYFHSGFVDLILSGLVGLRPQVDDNLIVNPIIDDSISYFRAEKIPYHGHDVSIQFDRDGSRYNQGRGLRVEIDGNVVASSETVSRLTATIKQATPSSIDTRITKSILLQQNSAEFPRGSASSGTDAARIHDAIDGRVWFYPEFPHGWWSDKVADQSEQWYAINFGNDPIEVSGAEIALFVDKGDFALPLDYVVSEWKDGQWVKIQGEGDRLVANGITNVKWSTRQATQIRVSFTVPANKSVRVQEFKVY
ncbi:unnamed protein product [Sympodiomycopsis kandeliae]